MRLAAALLWVNTRVILLVVFSLTVIPLGIAARLVGKDLLDTALEPDRESYWHERERGEFDPARLRRQF